MIMEAPGASRTGKSRLLGIVIALLTLVLLVAVGVYAYMAVFMRTGEKAIALIPSDAVLVATLDTTPSPAQTISFAKIAAAAQREGLYDSLAKSMSGPGAMNAIVQEIQPYWKRSFAVAGLPKPNGAKGDPDYVVLAAVSDVGAVRGILAKHGASKSDNGMEYFDMPKDQVCAIVLGTYLVVSNNPGALGRISDVYSGKTKSLNTLASYQSARSVLPSDTNLMVFMSPDAWPTLLSSATSITGAPAPKPNSMFHTTQWLAVGFRIVDSGLEVVMQTPLQATGAGKLPAPQAPIRSDLAQRLPAGACGLITVSQVSKYSDWMNFAGQSDPNSAKAINDGIATFEKATGMNVRNDILPGLNGDLTLAVYPDDAVGSARQVDGLIEIDDQNEGDPSTLIAKIRAYADRKQAENHGPKIQFTSHQLNGATIYAIDATTLKMIDSLVNPPAPSMGGAPPGVALTPGAPNGQGFRPPAVSAEPHHAQKTITYALIGKTVIVASSPKLLEKALDAYQSQKGALSDDPNYSPLLKAILPGSQSLFIISGPPIVDLVRHSFPPAPGGGPGVQPADVMAIFGNNSGMVCSGIYDGKTAVSNMTIRLDMDRLIHVIGVTAKQSASPPSPTFAPGGMSGSFGAPPAAPPVN